jgi:hypothetical protein
MGRFLSGVVSPIVLGGIVLGGMAAAQVAPSQSLVSTRASFASANEFPDMALDPASLLPDLPALPPTKATLIGGSIQKLDRIRDQITIQVFGGGKMKISFDPRTHIYNDGRQTSVSDLRQGDRVYIDTILDGSTVFARSIRLKTTTSAGESQGTVTSYRAGKDELEIRDALSPRVLKIRVTPQTRIVNGNRSVSPSELIPGTLVAVKFGPQQNGSDVAQELLVLAVPGSSFTFAGRVTSLDLRLGVLILDSSTDHKTYEIHFDPSVPGFGDGLREATDVTVVTRFDGNQYIARSLTVNPSSQQ